MKTPITSLFLLALLLISCAQTKPIIEDIEETHGRIEEAKIVDGEVTLNLYSKDKADTVESSIEYMYYESPSLPYQDTVNRMIKEYISGLMTFGEETMAKDSKLSVEFMEAAIDKFGEGYKMEMGLYDDNEDDVAFFGGVWQTLTSVSIYDENPEFVEVSLANWDYSGGAHGNSWSEHCMIDIQTGRELKLSDFFSNLDILTSRAEAIFRADQELSEDANLEEAGFWFDGGVFQLNENFVFNENSVDFLFNRYEIAAYAAGDIIITIPMEEVKDLLKRKVHF